MQAFLTRLTFPCYIMVREFQAFHHCTLSKELEQNFYPDTLRRSAGLQLTDVLKIQRKLEEISIQQAIYSPS